VKRWPFSASTSPSFLFLPNLPFELGAGLWLAFFARSAAEAVSAG
jgi:hypothetical protein